jgi:hypothetical protein
MLFSNQHIASLIVIFKEMFFMETIEITRKELYDIVWSSPITKLTLQYALSIEGLKKVCKQFEIPIPDASYWSKLKFNKKIKKEKLNPIFGGVDKIVLTIREEGNHPRSLLTSEFLFILQYDNKHLLQ